MAKKRKKKSKSLASCSGAGSILGSKKGSGGLRTAAGRKLAKCKVKKRKRKR